MDKAQQPLDVGKILQQIKEVISKNSSGIIAIPAKATPDAIAAGTSLYLGLTKLGKAVSLVSSEIPQSDLVAADKIQTTLSTGGNNLVVSFPYKDGAIDKVDYKIEGERFNLIIAPRDEKEKLNPDDVSYSYTGGQIEFIITIDAPNLNALGPIYQQNENVFAGKNIINIDRHLINNNYGTINFVVKTSSSTSELVYHVVRSLGVALDKEIATNIYSGIVMATNNFGAYSVNADTFETVAQLMRAGAIRRPMTPQFGRPGMPGTRPMAPVAPMGPGPGGMPQMNGMNNGFNQFGMPQAYPQQMPQMQQPMQQPMPQMQMPQPSFTPQRPQQRPQPRMQQPQQQPPMQQQRAIEDVEEEIASQEVQDEIGQAKNPENWLKPKLFSGKGGLI